ncbi:hypothetical protein BDV93DRAFT_88674 [Ceratobasidium sp. AG-I]|nr:hypothetical protein BDV93DRAFT_88674 [Ceratobasidium sp. AG-I]
MELRLPPIRELQLTPQQYAEYPYPKFQSYAQPDPSAPRSRDERLSKVLNHCKVLCAFADHYAAAPPNTDPPEIAQMVEHALQVIAILEDYKRSICPPAPPALVRSKRVWEDDVPEPPVDSTSSASASPAPAPAPSQEAHMHVFDGVAERQPPMDDVAKAAADRDMEDIRARRAAGQASSTNGKVKYKKRSRASPPGQCHSCEILDTPEWRRGPDGQRTLCNACGLHYAKLVRKRDRIISSLPEGVQAPPPIDIVYLRKSARLAAEHSAVNRPPRAIAAAASESAVRTRWTRI